MSQPQSPPRVWNEDGEDFAVGKLTSLPDGYRAKTCPHCGSSDLTGAIIVDGSGERQAIPTADEDDPNILCMTCGYWADAL